MKIHLGNELTFYRMQYDEFDASLQKDVVKKTMHDYYFFDNQYGLKKRLMLLVLITNKITVTRLAHLCAITTASTSATISRLVEDGIVRRDGKALSLTHPEFLFLLIKRDIYQDTVELSMMNQKDVLALINHPNFEYYFKKIMAWLANGVYQTDISKVPQVFKSVSYFIRMTLTVWSGGDMAKCLGHIDDVKIRTLVKDCKKWFEALKGHPPPELAVLEKFLKITWDNYG